MSDCGGKALNLCLIGQSVLQLNTAPHVCRGMWNQANSVADVNYTPSPRHLVHGDEDYEDGLTIISRLGEIENCRSPHCSNVSVVCNCEKTVQSDSHTSTVDETEHTSEQDGLKLSQLLRAFSLYERKPANRRSIGVLRNLTQSYHGNDLVNQEQLKRLERLQSHVDVGLQGTSLLIMLRLCRLDRNIVTFLRHGTLDKLLSMVECGSSRVLHRLVTAVIEQMVTSEDHAGLWLTTMVTTGLTVILQRMRMSVDDPITYGCACVLRTLARHAFFVPHILSLALDDINSLKKKHGRLRELYVEIFGQLLCHREVTDVTTMLDANIFPTLTDILKHGQCHLQKQVLLMVVSLTRSEGSLTMLRARVLPCIMSLWLNSFCSKVRECAVFGLCQLLSARSMSTRLEVLKEIGNFYHREVEKHDYLQLTDVLTLHVFERSLQDFTLSLVAGIRREARMERDRRGNITRVHLQPGKHNKRSRLNTLCHLVVILGIITQLRIDRFIKKQSENIKRKHCHVNENTVKLQLTHGATCVIDLLHIFTLKLVHSIGWTMLIHTVKEAYRKNIAAKQSLSGQHVSGGGTPTKPPQNRQRHESVDLMSIFEVEEVNLILAILGVVHLWVSCSADSATRCLCSSAKNGLLGSSRCDISTQWSATDLKERSEPNLVRARRKQPKTRNPVEADSKDSTESHGADSGNGCKKKTSKMLKSTTEKVYEGLCCELREELGLETGNNREHRTGHCCFSDDVDTVMSSQESTVDKTDLVDGERRVKLLQRNIRVLLYEAGVLESVGPWLACNNITIKRAVVDILSHMVQPLSDSVKYAQASSNEKSRQSEDTEEEEAGNLDDGTEMKEQHKEKAEDNNHDKKEDKKSPVSGKNDAKDSSEFIHDIDAPERAIDTSREGVLVEGSMIKKVQVEICDLRKDPAAEDSSSTQDEGDSQGDVAVDVQHLQEMSTSDVAECKRTSTTDSQNKQTDASGESSQSNNRHEIALRAPIEPRPTTFCATDYDQFARQKKERCQSASAIIRVRPSSGRPSSARPPCGRPSSGKARPSSGRPSSGKTRPSCGWPSSDSHPSDRPTIGRPWSAHKAHHPSSAPKSMPDRQRQHIPPKQRVEKKEAFLEHNVEKMETSVKHTADKRETFPKQILANEEIFLKQRVEQKETFAEFSLEVKDISPRQNVEKKETFQRQIRERNEAFPEQNFEKKEAFVEEHVEQKEVFPKPYMEKKETFLEQNVETGKVFPKQHVEKAEMLPKQNVVTKEYAVTQIKENQLTPSVGKMQLIVNIPQDNANVYKRHPVTAPKTLGGNKLQIVGRAPRRLSLEKTDSQKMTNGKQRQQPPAKRPVSLRGWKTQMNPNEPPVRQCQARLVDVCGKVMLQELFSKQRSVKINILCLLYQLTVHSQVHMLMSEKGVIHKLVDFLRVNDCDEDLQTMGLVLLQELFRHERRLNQLFCKLGGAPLLESMLSQGNVRLRPVVVQTLSMLSGEGTPPMVRTRRSSSSTSVCDIWDQIRERWLMEDKVSQMLNSRSCKDTRPDEIS